MKTLESIKVVLEATSEPLRKETQKAKKEMESCVKGVASEANKATQQMESAKKPVKNLTDYIREMNRKIKEFATQAQIDAGIKKYTDNFLQLQRDIDLTDKSIEKLKKRAREFSDSDKFEMSAEFKENEKVIANTEKALEKLNEKKSKMEQSGKAFEPTADFQEVNTQLEETKAKYAELIARQKEWESIGVSPASSGAFQSLLEDIKETEMGIRYLEGELDDLKMKGEDKSPTAGYRAVTDEIEKSNGKLNEHLSIRERMKADGTDMTETKKWRNVQDSIKAAADEKKRYMEQSRIQMDNGTHVEPKMQGFSSGSYIQAAETAAKAAPAAIKSQLSSAQGPLISLKNQIASTVKEIPVIGRLVTESSYLAKKGFSLIGFAAKKATDGIKRTGGAAASLIKRFVSGIPIIGRFTGGVNKNSNAFGVGLKSILKYGLGIRSLFVLVNRLRSALVEGFNNLSQYSNTTNQSLSLLKSQLNQLKNSLATAFEPILNAVTPYLSQLIDYVLSATNALAQFFAALTGKSTYTVAKRVNVDYAKSLGNTSSAADDANKSVSKLKRTLLGFDEVNKLDDNSDSGSSGSSGGSGGSGGTSPGDMFSTETIGSQFSNFADMIKEAWANADFTEIGRILGEKLNAALESIQWDKIKETSRKIAKSTATFLNGFIAEVDWELVGKTYAEGLNTVIEFGYTFVTTFDWKQFGTAIGQAVNGFIENLEWAKAGKTFSEGIKGILTTANTALEEIDWNQLGRKVGDFLTNIDWAGILAGVGKMIANALIAALNFADGLFTSICDGLKNVNWSDVAKSAGELFKKAWQLINVAVDVGVSLIKSGWSTVSEWVKGFIGGALSAAVNLTGNLVGAAWDTIKTVTGNLTSAAKKKVYEFKAKASGDWKALKGYVKDVVSKVKDKTANFTAKAKGAWTSLTDKAKSLLDNVKNRAATYTARSEGPWSAIASAAKTTYENVKSKTATFTAVASGAWDKISSFFSKAKNWFVNKTVNWKINFPHFELPHISFGTKTQTVLGKKVKIPTINVAWYATGGFPEEGPFYMNRGEIAGKFSNGKGVVANNQQITTGIAKAVGPAVYQAVMAAMQSSGGSGKNVIVTLDGDAKGIFKVVKAEAQNYMNSHGVSPFPV